jgi:6-phosphogluconolactonase
MGNSEIHELVQVYQDHEALSLAAATLFAREARLAAEARGRFLVLLSGGETPRRSYQLLGQEPLRSSVPWQAVQFFWGDERYLPHDHPLSNFGMARAALLDHLPLSEEQIHPIPYAATPHDSALAYEKELRSRFRDAQSSFDLALLGLGEDGHTASLFPGSEAVGESERWACEIYLAEQHMYRVTVTAPVLNEAALVVFLVAGSAKAGILHRVLEGEKDPRHIPAQLIKPVNGRVLWLVEREAARLLSGKTGVV